jgi:hypothetical protein
MSCSPAELISVSIEQNKFQFNQLYLQTVKKGNHLPYNGYKLYIANVTDSIVRLDASDSRLSVIAEVFYQGDWRPIEYLPRTWCGNSYHSVYLKQNEYWEFHIPKFIGKLKTKLRYKLIIDKDHYLYSNEVQTSINKGQLDIKQGHEPNGIMDPYNE